MNLGARLLRDLPIGLQENQQDVDVHTTPAFQAHARPYIPNEDGYLVERDTGLPVQSQKYAYDDLYKEVDLDWDQVFANDPDYQFACEVAGFVNVSVESLGDRGANEHRAAQRKQQEQLLIDERKARLIAFKDRVQELEKVREERRVTEAVRTRLATLHQQSFQPTVERWYWLGSMTGTAHARKAVPYWLLTDYIYDQYVSENLRRDRFAKDEDYFEPRAPAYAWVTAFLKAFSTRFGNLLSLSSEQLRFAYRVYLAFRDSVFAQLLNVRGAGADSDRRYNGLLTTLHIVHETIAATLAPTAIRQEAVTSEEADPALAKEELHFPDKADEMAPKTPLVPDRPPFTALFEEMVADVPNAPAMFTDATKRITFVDTGITRAFEQLMRQGIAPGLSPTGFTDLLHLLKGTIASDVLGDPQALAVFKTLIDPANSIASINRTFSAAFIAEKPLEQWKMLGFALWCLPDPTKKLKLAFDPPYTFTLSNGPTRLVQFTVNNLTQTAENLIGLIRDTVKKFADAAVIPFADRPLLTTQYSRLLLSVLFWNTCLPGSDLQNPLLADLLALVQRSEIQGAANRYAALRLQLPAKVPLLTAMTGPNGPAFKVITALRQNYGLAAHFMRELFRSTFTEKYARTEIDASLRVTVAPVPADDVTFIDDVRANVPALDVIRLAAALPPPPPAIPGLPAAFAALVAPAAGAIGPPLRLNDPAFFETWEKLYANLFFSNSNEPDPAAGPISSYWRPLFRAIARAARRDMPDKAALAGLWESLVALGPRFFTSRQQRLDGTVADFSGLSLKLTQGEDEPDNAVALRFEDAFRLRLAAATAAATLIPNVPGLGRLLQTMVFYEDVYYPWAVDEVNKAVAALTSTQQRMVQVLQDALTNTNTSVVKELKELAAGTYIPDPRFHMQAKFVGRFKFSAQFLSAVRAAYADLQSLARTSAKLRALNDDGRRPRPLPYDYSPLENVPMDVLTCNTDSAGGTREYLDLTATDLGIFTQLRSCMAAMVAQHIFAIRLDAPDEYKSVVQHRRSPQQLKAAQQAMTQFVFYRTSGTGWRAALV